MKKINIIEFLKTYLLTLILIIAAFICSYSAFYREHNDPGIEKKTVSSNRVVAAFEKYD
ncbi:hypothetical protein [Clostridium sp. YIM B02555]|uniref:hypothetical protein n=1 Tax=Clostridium sp. YIM B02555 TaxID=2911968 RepID=UPI001EEE0CAF|nr:hypothetical protein [Clostridium sp. YIM B02555]